LDLQFKKPIHTQMRPFLVLTFLFIQNLVFAINFTIGTTGSGANFICDGIDDQVEIQQAINSINSSGGGDAIFFAGSYNLSARIEPKNNVRLLGNGINSTTLIGNFGFDYLIFNNITGPVSNFEIHDMTINPNNEQNSSGIRLEEVTNVVLKNLQFINVGCDGWHLVLGVKDTDAMTGGTVRSNNVLVDNCTFDGHKGSLEMLLLYNITDAKIQNCTFKNKTLGCPINGNRPVLGLWQYTNSTCIQNCIFQDNQSIEAIYYSNTCDNTLITNCTFSNTGGIRGSNISDNGVFDGGPALNLSIRECDFIGGLNDIDGAAIQIGAVEGVLIENCNIEEYVIGIVYENGNNSGGFSIDIIPIHVAVVNTNIENCNNTENLYGIHPGVLYTGDAIGDVHHYYICGKIEETEVWPDGDMIHCFGFIGGNEIDHFYNKGMHLIELPPFGEEWHYEDMTTTGPNNTNEQCDNSSSAPSFCNICTQTNISSTQVYNLINPINPTSAGIIDALYSLNCNASILLPIDLISFEAISLKDGNLLKWEIANAVDFNYFEVQKANSSFNFEKIGKVNFSDTSYLFQFKDINPDPINYYRLKLIDDDGSFSYSNVISIRQSGFDKSISIAPNPFDTKIQLNWQKETLAEIQIYNIQGQIIYSEPIFSTEKSIDTQSFLPGIYFVSISFGRERIIQKLVKSF